MSDQQLDQNPKERRASSEHNIQVKDANVLLIENSDKLSPMDVHLDNNLASYQNIQDNMDFAKSPTMVDSQIVSHGPSDDNYHFGRADQNFYPHQNKNELDNKDKFQVFNKNSTVWIGEISIINNSEIDLQASKIESDLTFKESNINIEFHKQKFGQFYDKVNELKIQGTYKDDKLDGLALVIKVIDGQNDADFGFFSQGVKIEEVEDDESMYIYDMMYQEFKEKCEKANIKCFNWIEQDCTKDSEVQLRLSRAGLSRQELDSQSEQKNKTSSDIQIQDLSSVNFKGMKQIQESHLEDQEDNQLIFQNSREENKGDIVESMVIDSAKDFEFKHQLSGKVNSNNQISGISEQKEEMENEEDGVEEEDEEEIEEEEEEVEVEVEEEEQEEEEENENIHIHNLNTKEVLNNIKDKQDSRQNENKSDEILIDNVEPQDDHTEYLESLDGQIIKIEDDENDDSNTYGQNQDALPNSYAAQYEREKNNKKNKVKSMNKNSPIYKTENHSTPYRSKPQIKSESKAYVTHYSPAGHKHESIVVEKNAQASEFKITARSVSKDSNQTESILEGSGDNKALSKSKEPIFKTFSPSKRILSDNQFITQHVDNVQTKPARKHIFPASQSKERVIDPEDPYLTLEDYEIIMEREKHIKGYYRSYLERWGKKRQVQKPSRNFQGNTGNQQRLLKDNLGVKNKYKPRPQANNAQENKMMKHQDPLRENTKQNESPLAYIARKKKKLSKKNEGDTQALSKQKRRKD